MKHEHLTIMFTDIKGFTSRTSKSSRKDLQKLLELHEELIEPVFEDFGGTVIKTIGDAFMVKFSSPTDAVLCGREIQRVLDTYNREKDKDKKIEVRIAINSGECIIKDDDVFGETVNIAARLEGVADAGDIYFTEAVYLSMNKNEIPTAEVGYRHFKGVPDEIKVYKVIREKKKKTLLGKKDKQIVRKERPQGGWWKRNWKWVALGLLIFFILSAIANNNKKKANDQLKELGLEGQSDKELAQEIRGIGEDVISAIDDGRRLDAQRGLDRLRKISDKFNNPDDMEDGIAKLQKRFDTKFNREPAVANIEPVRPEDAPILDPNDPDTPELAGMIRDIRRDIRDGDRLNARKGIDDLYNWQADGQEGLDEIIPELEQLYKERFSR